MDFILFFHEALLATTVPSSCTGIKGSPHVRPPPPLCAHCDSVEPPAPDLAPRAAVRLKPMTVPVGGRQSLRASCRPL